MERLEKEEILAYIIENAVQKKQNYFVFDLLESGNITRYLCLDSRGGNAYDEKIIFRDTIRVDLFHDWDSIMDETFMEEYINESHVPESIDFMIVQMEEAMEKTKDN